MHTVFIVNPLAGAGAGARLAREIGTRRGDPWARAHVVQTHAPGHAAELARRALEEGARRVVSCGGDGTHREVARGMLDEHGRPHCPDAVFSVVPCGTGNDLVRTLGIPHDPARRFDHLIDGPVRPMDAVAVELDGGDGRRLHTLSINVSDCGLGGEVIRRVNRSSRRLGGRACFLLATVATLLTFRAPRVRLTADDRTLVERDANLVVIGNARYAGGGMAVAPTADPTDGLLEIFVLGRFSLVTFLRRIRTLYRGDWVEDPAVVHLRARQVQVEADPPAAVGVDGENPGRTPAAFRILPAALNVQWGVESGMSPCRRSERMSDS